MSDEHARALARRAAVDDGDESADEALAAARRRAGSGPHADKVGELVLIETVQCAWYGRLVGVVPCGGGAHYAQLRPCFWLSNTESPTVGDRSARPRAVWTSAEQPADVLLGAAVIVTGVDPAIWSLAAVTAASQA